MGRAVCYHGDAAPRSVTDTRVLMSSHHSVRCCHPTQIAWARTSEALLLSLSRDEHSVAQNTYNHASKLCIDVGDHYNHAMELPRRRLFWRRSPSPEQWKMRRTTPQAQRLSQLSLINATVKSAKFARCSYERLS